MSAPRTADRAAASSLAARVCFWSYLAVAAATLLLVGLARVREDPGVLAAATRESGPFENATVLALVALGAWCLTVGRRQRNGRAWRIGLPLFGALAVAAGLEEMSWGQHLFGFSTPDFLAGRNIQNESNLHNLIDSEIFGALVHVPVYALFVYPALIVTLVPSIGRRWPISRIPAWAYPRPHTILVFCFGAGLHPWDDPVTIPDSAALVTALILFALTLTLARLDDAPWLRIHFAAVCLATVVFASSGAIFGYINLQYEIRELIVVLGFSYWLYSLPQSGPGRRARPR
jgi:hypothetical protein